MMPYEPVPLQTRHQIQFEIIKHVLFVFTVVDRPY